MLFFYFLPIVYAAFEIDKFEGDWYGQLYAQVYRHLEGPEFVIGIFEEQNKKYQNLKCPHVQIL